MHFDFFGDSNIDNDLGNLLSPGTSPAFRPSDLSENTFTAQEVRNASLWVILRESGRTCAATANYSAVQRLLVQATTFTFSSWMRNPLLASKHACLLTSNSA